MKLLFIMLYPSRFHEASWPRIGFFAKYPTTGNDVAVTGSFLKAFKKARLTRAQRIGMFVIITVVMTQNIFSLTFNLLYSIGTPLALFTVLWASAVVISDSRTGELALG
jgi:hypothetical protein